MGLESCGHGCVEALEVVELPGGHPRMQPFQVAAGGEAREGSRAQAKGRGNQRQEVVESWI